MTVPGEDADIPETRERSRVLGIAAVVLGIALVVCAAYVGWARFGTNEPTDVPTVPGATLVRATRDVHVTVDTLGVVYVGSRVSEDDGSPVAVLRVTFPGHGEEEVPVGTKPVERYRYTFTLVGTEGSDALLEIVDSSGEQLGGGT